MTKETQLPAPGQSPAWARYCKHLAWEALHAAIWALIFALLMEALLHAALPCEAPVHFAVPNAPARCLVAPAKVDI